MLLHCDAINRATATEWLSFSVLQLGDWLETSALINDLFITHNHFSTNVERLSTILLP